MQSMRRAMAVVGAVLIAFVFAETACSVMAKEQIAAPAPRQTAAVAPVLTGAQPATVPPVTGTEVAAPEQMLVPLYLSATPHISCRDCLTLTYDLDRSEVPPLTYQALTLRIYVGPVRSVAVTATMAAGRQVPVSYEHDPAAGTVTVTTAGDRIEIKLEGVQDSARVGTFEKAALKGGATWAWSHSFDDNVDLFPSIDVLREHGYRGTLYLIGELIEDARDEDWIVDAPAIKELLAEGWGIGNHTWDHACNPPGIGAQTVVSGYNRLKEIVADSPLPDYRIIAFAAPCYKSAYHPIIQQMIAAGQTDVLFNESGGRDLMVVDPGAAQYAAGGQIAAGFSYTMPVGRDPALSVSGGLSEAMAVLDWMSAEAGPERHFWYNTFSHGGHAADLDTLATYISDNYGEGGSGEAWVAPADEIYSYLLVRDRTDVALSVERGRVAPAASQP